MSIETLQARHGIPDKVQFVRRSDGAEVVKVTADHGSALVALKGAHVMSFIPAGGQDLLWVSPDTFVAGPGAIRGGIPVCWPWFATHQTDAAAPAHGFARTEPWVVQETVALPGGDVRLAFTFATRPEHQRWFEGSAEAILTVTVGRALNLSLETHNSGGKPFHLTQALHSYFNVGDIARVSVAGLEGTEYLDKVEAFARKRQAGPVTIDREVDRIYVATSATTTIDDPAMGRRITVTKQGSASTVVWNPWAERAARMGDLGPDGWRHFLCVETTNAGPDTIHLAPGERHILEAQISLTP